jgi:pimeloyl-ACP methyl ester carboxylesterase
MMNERRYRDAERRLWGAYGLEPDEQQVRLAGTDTVVRVQESGTGEPVLFIHGGPNAGTTWAPLLAHLDGFRCLLVDRPGTGLSDDYVIRAGELPRIGASFVPDVLDGLGLDRAHVVASSFGGHLALRSAAAHPERFERMVQMASPAAVPGEQYPPFMRFMRSGLVRRILAALPPNDRANRSIFRQIGHGASLDAGRIPEIFFEWYLALGRDTNTMRNDGEMIGREILGHLDAVRLSEGLLASVKVPTLFVWGEDDGFGGIDNGRRIADLLPDAELETMPAAGHLPWLDDPVVATRATRAFLSRSGVAGDRAEPSTPTAAAA